MGRWTDIAEWLGPITNSGDGDGRAGETEDRMTGHVGVVVHIAQGTYLGTISWQRNPDADVGSHFVLSKDGRRAQMIDTDERSWCQSAGNSTWLSIENEGYNTQALTAQQVEGCAQILARANREYGVPLQISNSPSTPGLGWHGMGGAAWGGHYDCPGEQIKAQRTAIIARAREILDPTPTPLTDEEDDDMVDQEHFELPAGFACDEAGNFLDGKKDLIASVPVDPGSGNTTWISATCEQGTARLRVAVDPDGVAGWSVHLVNFTSNSGRAGLTQLVGLGGNVSIARCKVGPDDTDDQTPIGINLRTGRS